MNVLSQALKNRHYPKTMIVSRDQAWEIMDHFYCILNANPTSFYDLNKYATYFEAYYNSKTGINKKCLVLMEK
jgi:hypothetical protein